MTIYLKGDCKSSGHRVHSVSVDVTRSARWSDNSTWEASGTSFKPALALLRSTGSKICYPERKERRKCSRKHFGPFGHAWPSNISPRTDIAGLDDMSETIAILLVEIYWPFLRKLHGAFFALFAKTARCSGVNSYLCEYLHVDYAGRYE